MAQWGLRLWIPGTFKKGLGKGPSNYAGYAKAGFIYLTKVA